MTISLERPTRSLTPESQVFPHYTLVDPYDEMHTVVELRVAVTRDQLAAAVEMGGHAVYGGELQPDLWTVTEVRAFAESNIIAMGSLELQQGAEAMAQMAEPDFYDRATHTLVLAVYRAVDRAYPGVGK